MSEALTLLLCFGGIVLVSVVMAFVIKIVAHIPNARRNADLMYRVKGGSWTKHYINEFRKGE